MSIPYFALQIPYYFYTNYIGNINGDFSIILESLAFGGIGLVFSELLSGMAWSKFGLCDNILLYGPYIKAMGWLRGLILGKPHFAPVILRMIPFRDHPFLVQ